MSQTMTLKELKDLIVDPKYKSVFVWLGVGKARVSGGYMQSTKTDLKRVMKIVPETETVPVLVEGDSVFIGGA